MIQFSPLVIKKKIHTPVPLDAGGLTIAVAEALLSDEAVLQLILNAEGM